MGDNTTTDSAAIDEYSRTAVDYSERMPSLTLESLSNASWAMNGLVLVAAAVALIVLSKARFSTSEAWQATITPLASIVGSGFLIVVPLLGSSVGDFAVLAMAGIVILGYGMGGTIRYQITHVEDIIEGDSDHELRNAFVWLARVSKLALSFAYVVAVAFYLEMLGAFVLRLFDLESQTIQKLIASALIVGIGVFGNRRGLQLLERLETHAVNTKLAVIAALLVGLVAYNAGEFLQGDWALSGREAALDTRTLRELLGAFLIVQGFETSRYLRGEYSPELRISAMRRAQLISGCIYVLFVALATILLGRFEGVSETAVIDISAPVALALPYLLVVGAVMSQFSAAVADTIASGGLVEEGTNGSVDDRTVYLGVVAVAVGLLWATDVISIVAYASRAFAVYYAIQASMASLHCWTSSARGRSALFGLLGLVMVGVAVFGIPAEAR